MKQFSWEDRDTAADDMLQLVRHGTETIRLGALQALQGIRSQASADELKQIVLDTTWAFDVREAALNALAALLDEVYFPELLPQLRAYWPDRLQSLEKINGQSLQTTVDRRLRAELNFYTAILHFVGYHLSNYGWLHEAIVALDTSTQIDVLRAAIGATCQTPIEERLMAQLIEVLKLNPELFDLDVALDIANHGNETADQWLVAQAARIVELAASADQTLIEGIMGYSPELTAAVVKLNPALSELDRFAAYRQQAANDTTSSATTLDWTSDYDFTSTSIGEKLHQFYAQAEAGDDAALTSLFVLVDDYRTSLSVKAVITHLIGELWPREGVLEWLCLLIRDEQVYNDAPHYMPVRLEAAEALRNTETATAWEVMADTVCLTPHFSASPYVDWLTDLTDALSHVPSTRKEGAFKVSLLGGFHLANNTSSGSLRWMWTVKHRPWFERLGEANDDLEAILADQ